jgi:hypothetical protein
LHLLRFSHAHFHRGDTIALMAKFKPVRAKGRGAATRPAGALPCVILVLAGMALLMLFLYFVLKNANG